jgi:glycosyltransferase involved in cell wall biosynthesis
MKISVVIPAYNAAAFLPRCLKSVYAQTLKPHQIIVVNDGSSDGSAKVAAELGATVVNRPNGGLSAARNTGIQNATGDWIALLDADDLWSPEKLARQAEKINPNTVLIYTGIRIFDDHGVRSELPAMDPAAVRNVLRYRNPITPSTALIRRDAVVQDGGFREDIRACEDWEMWFRLQHLGEFQAISDPLTDYYVYPQSLSANPERMLTALDRIIDTTLVANLNGIQRWMWRRRIRAMQLCSAGLIARDNGLEGELNYMVKSLQSWPSPLFEPQRFAMLAVSAKNKLRSAR